MSSFDAAVQQLDGHDGRIRKIGVVDRLRASKHNLGSTIGATLAHVEQSVALQQALASTRNKLEQTQRQVERLTEELRAARSTSSDR